MYKLISVYLSLRKALSVDQRHQRHRAACEKASGSVPTPDFWIRISISPRDLCAHQRLRSTAFDFHLLSHSHFYPFSKMKGLWACVNQLTAIFVTWKQLLEEEKWVRKPDITCLAEEHRSEFKWWIPKSSFKVLLPVYPKAPGSLQGFTQALPLHCTFSVILTGWSVTEFTPWKPSFQPSGPAGLTFLFSPEALMFPVHASMGIYWVWIPELKY